MEISDEYAKGLKSGLETGREEEQEKFEKLINSIPIMKKHSSKIWECVTAEEFRDELKERIRK